MREEVLLRLYALGTVPGMTWQALADEIGVNFVTIWRYRGGKNGKGPVSTPDNRAQRAILDLYDRSVLRGRDPRTVLQEAGVSLPAWVFQSPSSHSQ
jgi:transcriptional regulator with XRE-family HTH domain